MDSHRRLLFLHDLFSLSRVCSKGSQKVSKAMTSNEPRLSILEIGSSKPIPPVGWSGLQQAMHFQSCRERQWSAWQARRDMPISHLCRGERSLENSRGAQRRNIRTETHLGDKSLKIYCHLIQQITTHSRIRNNRNLSSKQNKTKSNPLSILKPIFWPIPQPLIFQKDCLLLNPRNTLTGI